MSDPVLLALIAAGSSVALQVISLVNLALVKRDTAQTKENMHTLEKNTNSIKDALVDVTAKQKYAEGLKDGQSKPVPPV